MLYHNHRRERGCKQFLVGGPTFPTGECHARINPGCLQPWHYYADPDWEPGRARRECCRRHANESPRICYQMGEHGLLDDCGCGCGCCCDWGHGMGHGMGHEYGRREFGHGGHQHGCSCGCGCPFPCDCRSDCGCYSDGCRCSDDEHCYDEENGNGGSDDDTNGNGNGNGGTFQEEPAELLLRRLAADGTPLFGSVFTIFDQNGKNIASVMSGHQGLARFHNLRRGAYRIMETVSPAGHVAAQPMNLTMAERRTAIINGQVVHGIYDVRGM